MSNAIRIAMVVVCLSMAACGHAQTAVPYSSLVNNNTSASDTFQSQSNGNLGANNVSKVDVHTLLYPGETTKVFAHLMVWFGGTNHMNIGYSSTDPAQVHRQITDMVSRGIDGVLVDWYGPNNNEDQATKLVMAEAETHPGFMVGIIVDGGAIKYDSCSGCNPQQALTADVQYLEKTYFGSPAYFRINGVPVVANFGIQYSYTIDWNAVSAATSSHPLFIYQNSDAFTRTGTSGGFAWVMPTTTDYGMNYLNSFYNTGLAHPNEETFGATYKGFNDTLASWGSKRIMAQQCGQTWLQTFTKINKTYNSGKQLPYLQLVTWNDYEEATEIESGIDPCFGLSVTAANNALSWTTSGNESVVDHYSVFDSLDGASLTKLGDFAPGTRSLNLCGYSLPNGTHQLYVQEVSKPSLANRLPPAVKTVLSCVPPQVTMTAPGSTVVPANGSAAIGVSLDSTFNVPTTVNCATQPNTVTCSVTP